MNVPTQRIFSASLILKSKQLQIHVKIKYLKSLCNDKVFFFFWPLSLLFNHCVITSDLYHLPSLCVVQTLNQRKHWFRLLKILSITEAVWKNMMFSTSWIYIATLVIIHLLYSDFVFVHEKLYNFRCCRGEWQPDHNHGLLRRLVIRPDQVYAQACHNYIRVRFKAVCMLKLNELEPVWSPFF